MQIEYVESDGGLAMLRADSGDRFRVTVIDDLAHVRSEVKWSGGWKLVDAGSAEFESALIATANHCRANAIPNLTGR